MGTTELTPIARCARCVEVYFNLLSGSVAAVGLGG